MRKWIAALLLLSLFVSQTTVFAIHETTNTVNERYAAFITKAIEKSQFEEEQLDKEHAYVIEKTNTTIYENGSALNEFYIAIPLLGTDDISYTRFYKGEHRTETRNMASMLGVETYLDSKLDTYIEENELRNVTEAVHTIFYGRTGVDAYRVVADGETYFIPYHIEFQYNLAEDEACELVFGKAYPANEFVDRLKKEEQSFAAYREQQKKAEEERIAAEAEKKAAKYRPVYSLDENGDTCVTVNGVNLEDVRKMLLVHIEPMGFGSNIEMRIKHNAENYLAKHWWQKGSNTAEVASFAEGLFDEIKTQIITGKPETVQNVSYCNFHLKHDEGYKSIKHQVEISVWKDGVKIQVNREDPIECKVQNADAILCYLEKYSNAAFEGFAYEKNDENTPHVTGTLDGLTKTDVITFSYKLPEDTDNGLSKEVALPGENIAGTFEKYKENKYKSTYILTLSGSLGTISLYRKNQSSLSGEDEYFSNNIPLAFFHTYRYENGNLVEYKIGKDSDTYEWKMIFAEGNISAAYLDNTKCTDLEYTRLAEDSKLSEEYADKEKENIKKDEATEKETETKKTDKVVVKEARECADALYNLGLFRGTDKGYELDKGLTREESATILVRLLGEEEKIKTDDFKVVFTDVDKNRWSYSYVMYCYENNITKGTSSETFSPDKQIDAEQFVALLMRLLGFVDVNPETALDKSVEYRLLPADMVEKLKEANVFTRGEMVQIVYNSLKTKMADETVFSDYLLEKSVLTEVEIEQMK